MNTPAFTVILVLASSSPYRKMLLERLRIPFRCHRPEIDETPAPNETPVALVKRLAQGKAASTLKTYPDALIIGSDQVAVFGKRILNKPGDHARARAQLQQLCGHTVRFHTGLCVWDGRTGSVQTDSITTKVKFRDLTLAEIERYLIADRPYDCAGSFKSEGLGISLLSSIHGDDPAALIGLPLIRLCEMLRKVGLELP